MIPVFEPVIGEDEIEAVVDALRKGEVSGTFGKYIEDFENEFASYVGCKHGITVNSGTSALHLAVAALDLQPGDEVLVSSSTNIATALAALHNGAVPVPVDSEATTWNLDLDLIESLITPRTKAIIPVHLYGHPVDMDRLMEIANKHNLIVIEDCAESHGATVRGRMTGSFGHMACFSFYANKVITTGEGGMITTNDHAFAERVKLLRNLAFTQPRFKHELAGFNFRMPGFVAALGLAQFRKIDHIVEQKRRVAHRYNEKLKDVPGIHLPAELDWAKNVYWMYGIVVDPLQFGIDRNKLVEALAESGIQTRTFFCPMNQQPVLEKMQGFRDVQCPVADSLWENGLYLPSTWNLSDETIDLISDAIRRAPQWEG
ncbi:MAG: DegT/DnrJ/EryC1/StrS family aminotransferase [Anaerolineales bacterium]|nr:DegT/DnrJ/EryC1/StrS family aminotransferase [Anaerolineales bacterium]